MSGPNCHLSILTLNVNGLNSPIKCHRLVDQIKIKMYLSVAYRDTSHPQRSKNLKVKGWRKKSQVDGKEKWVGVDILISDDVDFDVKNIKRYEEITT